jgi:putative hydrolase of the HAD superfamily
MTVTGVLFDLGGTIIRNQFSPPETFKKILEQKGIQVTEKEVQEALKKTEKDLADFLNDSGKIQSTDFYNLWDIQVLRFLGIESYTADLISDINTRWSDVCGVDIFPDVIPAVESLRKRNIKSGIVSNAYEDEIEEIFERINLPLSTFDCYVGVDTMGKRKPHPAIFLHALDMLDVPVHQALFIGDDLDKDYYGAEQAGIRSLLLVRDGNPPGNVRYILSLTSLEEFLSNK